MCTRSFVSQSILSTQEEGINTVNCQMAQKPSVKRQKRNIFYRQPSGEQAIISRQMFQVSLIKN